MEIYRDGITHKVDGKISVHTTPAGHVIESWETNGKRVYFANLNDSVYCAHGDTPEQAIADAQWKDPKLRPSIEDLVNEIRPIIKTRKINVKEFRLLTGACVIGCRDFLEQKGLPLDIELTVEEFKPIGGEWANTLENIIMKETAGE